MAVKRPPAPEYGDLAPFNGLIDISDIHGWLTYLGVCERGWWLEVRDKRELLARASSWVLSDAARVCGETLEKTGRLS